MRNVRSRGVGIDTFAFPGVLPSRIRQYRGGQGGCGIRFFNRVFGVLTAERGQPFFLRPKKNLRKSDDERRASQSVTAKRTAFVFDAPNVCTAVQCGVRHECQG